MTALATLLPLAAITTARSAMHQRGLKREQLDMNGHF
jgi:hypothetical protein